MRLPAFTGALIALAGMPVLVCASPTLAVNGPFAVQGGNVTYTLHGTPGAAYTLYLSQSPAQESRGAAGTLFLDKTTLSAAANGTLDATGTGSKTLSLSGEPNAIWYAQGEVTSPDGSRLSNAVPVRVVGALPSGPRETLTVAVTPNGTKAYVGNEVDGSVSVVDAVNDVKLAELPITIPAEDLPYRPIDIAVDPDGRHAFVVNTAADKVAVIDVATDATVAQLSVPRGSRRVDFDFSVPPKRIYITNEVSNALVVFRENPPNTFTRLPNIVLQGDDPTALRVLPDRRIVVGNRATHDLEFVDPLAPPGSTTLARTPIGGLPFDIEFAAGKLFVPTFVATGGDVEGFNRVLTVNPGTFQVTGNLFEDVGTDYLDIAATDSLIAVAAASTGTVILADPVTGSVLGNVELAPGQPTATPQELAFVKSGGAPTRLYAVDYFRETLRPITVTGGPPFNLQPEIALAWTGAPRVPLSGDLSDEEDGDWFFRSVNMFGGTAFAPNRVTCYTCHVDGASDNNLRGTIAPPFWGIAQTGPWGQHGDKANLKNMVVAAMNHHNHTGQPLFPGSDTLMMTFLQQLTPPQSIFRTIAGQLTPDARQGKTLFEGVAGCTTCHKAPLFIPAAPNPKTIAQGIGTGLVPANVPSLRGIWALAPYLADGSAKTLKQVLTANPNDRHGQLTAGLTATQIDQLVAYLQSL
jgi:YVTN family beta-propeller protein